MARLTSTQSATYSCVLVLQLLLLVALASCFHSSHGFSHTAFPRNTANVDVLSRRCIAPGDRIPDVCLNWGFNPMKEVNMVEYTADEKVLILGVPAAFTETVIPTFFDHQAGLKQLGIYNVIVYTANDSAVVGIWNKQLVDAAADAGHPNSLVTFFGDPSGAFTKACGMELDQTPRLTQLGLFGRCKPFALYVDHGVVRDVVMNDESDAELSAPFLMQRIRAIQKQ